MNIGSSDPIPSSWKGEQNIAENSAWTHTFGNMEMLFSGMLWDRHKLKML